MSDDPNEPTRAQLASAIAEVVGDNPGLTVLMAQQVARLSAKGKWALVTGDIETFKRELAKVRG